ncbi:hypothetical protein [Candidatus Formimonas warabiya]|uniref:Uncharacterized protein n=1 Tax=Formimonas warabiya TaxID=1761012 RepID=A0A3G1KWK6_FORW1|nr:hypothetical protein [Candidatus Formimonas warabiya]ATW26777.1 hypothetical protein DCMF_20195 [Candidatus Formimonas warabiya]
MSLQSKRRIFFVIVGIIFAILVLMVMWQPFLAWSDTLTMQGETVLGIPLSQFLVLFSSFGMAILVTVLYNVDTKVLTVKTKDKEKK